MRVSQSDAPTSVGVYLLGAEGFHGVSSGGSAGGEVAGEGGCEYGQQPNARESYRIHRAYFVEQAP